MRSDDDDRQLWDELYQQFGDRDGASGFERGRRDEGDEPGRRPRRRRSRRRLRPEASERLVDAALGVLDSVRVLIDVAEDVLVDHRDRAGDNERARAEQAWTRQRGDADEPIDLQDDAPIVRDIPFAD